MRYRVLGPLRAGDAIITAGRDRVVLAMLLLQPNRVVGVHTLIDAVWDRDPPATARTQLQTCVSRLRRALDAARITTHPEGYAIAIAPEDLDATDFERLVAEARGGATPENARRLLRQALDLWQGPAFAGLEVPAIRRAATVLDERYAVAAEDWAELELDGGLELDLPAELAELTGRFPLRERLRGQLMRALCRAGRPAEALAEYRRFRSVLHDELGIEPGTRLQDLHRRILSGEVTADEPDARPPIAPVRSLPRSTGDFTGREALAAGVLDDLARGGEEPVVQVIDGMAGVGKTALVLHLAARVGDRYPDAHLFIDLHGHSDREQVDPAAALVTLLRQLGVEPERVPAGLDERTAMWRSALAGRRCLIILDNAASSAQVVPLLPGSGTSLTLVTSRSRLTGLDGVRPRSLDVLGEDEAVDLFTRIVGDRALSEPAAVADVVRRCGLLPLAIRLAAARLARRRRWLVADLVRRLGDAVLPELAAEDRTVVAAFALSYRHLPDRPRRLFRLLAVYPGERFEATTAAAIADLPLDDAEDILDTLVDAYLVEEPAPGRYRLHDLMREYAATLVAADPPAERRDAELRMFEHALRCAVAVSAPVESLSSRRTALVLTPDRPELLPAGDVDPYRWIDAEHTDYLAILRAAETAGSAGHVWRLARAAWRLWFLRGYVDDLVEAHERGLSAARSIGDPHAELVMANYLASGLHRSGRVRESAAMLDAAYRACSASGELAFADLLLGNLAVVLFTVGELDASEAAAAKALASGRRRQDLGLILNSVDILARVHDRRGDLRESLRWQRRCLITAAVYQAAGQRYLALSCVAVLRMRLGDHRPAERLLRLCVVLNDRYGRPSILAEAKSALGTLHRREGRYAEAAEEHRQALVVAEATGEHLLRSLLGTELGTTLLAQGDRAGAVALFRQAAEQGRAGEGPYEEARALAGWAAAVAEDDPVAARRYAEQALTVFRKMNVPEQQDVEKWLDGAMSGSVWL